MTITATRLTQAAGICAAVAGADLHRRQHQSPACGRRLHHHAELVIRNSKVLMCALALPVSPACT